MKFNFTQSSANKPGLSDEEILHTTIGFGLQGAHLFELAAQHAGKITVGGHFARGIERRLSELPRGKTIPARELPAIAFAHAGALLSLVTWWIDRGMRESPEEMDQLFHRMVWNGASR